MLGRKGGGTKLRGALQSSEGFREVQRDSVKFRTTQGPSARARPLRQEAIPWARAYASFRHVLVLGRLGHALQGKRLVEGGWATRTARRAQQKPAPPQIFKACKSLIFHCKSIILDD